MQEDESRKRLVQAAALYFGVSNLLLGLSGFVGPFVTGNEEGLINVETGQLFGVVAMNWAHALVLLAFGLYGIAARRSHHSAATYFWAVVGAFGLLALLGLLAHSSLLRITDPEGTPLVFEIAIDWAATVLHLSWMVLGLIFVLRGREAMPEPRHQTAHA